MKLLRVLPIIFSCFAIIFSCSDNNTELATIDVDFTADVQNITAGTTIKFKDLSIGDISKWDWTFEGGAPATSTLQSPEVTYDTPGTYKVTLKVSDAAKNKELTREAFIVVKSSQVVADFEINTNSSVQNENVIFTDKSTGDATSWNWEFIPKTGSTITSTEQNPVIAFSEPNVYSVKLTVSNSDFSDQIVKTDILTVIDNTSVSANFIADATNVYTGKSVQFTDISVGTADTYTWTFEGGTPSTSTAKNPTITYNTPGRYKVTLVASNPNKSSTVEKTDYIYVVPGDGLAAFFPFDTDATDAGPNMLTTNAPETIVYNGVDRKGAEKAAVFDSTAAIVVPDNAALNFDTSDFSVGVWIKTDITSKMMLWQESGALAGGDNQTWMRMGDNTTSRLLRFDTEDSTGGAIINVGDNNITSITDGQWHFIVGVRDATQTHVYVDGVLILDKDVTPAKDVSNEQDFKIGGQEKGGPGSFDTAVFFNGLMDEMLIYNKALTPEEVATLYNL